MLTFPKPFYHHYWLLSELGLAFGFETEKVNFDIFLKKFIRKADISPRNFAQLDSFSCHIC